MNGLEERHKHWNESKTCNQVERTSHCITQIKFVGAEATQKKRQQDSDSLLAATWNVCRSNGNQIRSFFSDHDFVLFDEFIVIVRNRIAFESANTTER